MADTALLIIDIQNDYFPGGAMELEGAEAAGAKAGSAIEHFRSKGLPVIHVRHLSTRPGSTFFLPNTKGAEIHAGVARKLLGKFFSTTVSPCLLYTSDAAD